jgi:hypothetical protein
MFQFKVLLVSFSQSANVHEGGNCGVVVNGTGISTQHAARCQSNPSTLWEKKTSLVFIHEGM